jgi:hypothetical protein
MNFFLTLVSHFQQNLIIGKRKSDILVFAIAFEVESNEHQISLINESVLSIDSLSLFPVKF